MVFEAAIKNKCFYPLRFFRQAQCSEGLDDFLSVSCMYERKRDRRKHKESEGSRSQKARKCVFVLSSAPLDLLSRSSLRSFARSFYSSAFFSPRVLKTNMNA